MAEPNLFWNIAWKKMSENEKNSPYKHLDRYSIVRDTSLPESKKENRILPIILIPDSPLYFEVECVMDGYDKETSQGTPNLRVSFQHVGDPKYELSESTDDQATWNTSFNITEKDYGNQRITCDYEQRKAGYTDYSKSIELFFEIYKQTPEVNEAEDSKCDSSLNCDMTSSILYEGGQNRNDLVFETLEKQALTVHEGGKFTDGSPQNQFTVCACDETNETNDETDETKAAVTSMSSGVTVLIVVLVAGLLLVGLFVAYKKKDTLIGKYDSLKIGRSGTSESEVC